MMTVTPRIARWISGLVVGVSTLPGAAEAQLVGTMRWQLRNFCNVVTLTVTANGDVDRLEGTDDQCGGPNPSSVVGTAFDKPNGQIGIGLTIVVSPTAAPVHVNAAIDPTTLNGTWRDSTGRTGQLVFTPGAGSGGNPRPLPAPVVPPAIQLRADGALLAAGTGAPGPIPASGPGDRMMWFPGKAAFRAGTAEGVEWDEPNVGVGSIALGTSVKASGSASAALGMSTTASGYASTALGLSTMASGAVSTAMGRSTTSSGDASLAAGSFLSAGGSASVALGSYVSASTNGTFMFGDRSTTNPLLTFAPNQFLVRAAGGVGFYSNANLTTGVVLHPSSNAWSSASDVRTKTDFRPLPHDEGLDKIAAMPVQEWSYIAQGPSVRHIGPTAQDFHAAFGLGEDPLRISTLDADGVALAAVRALEARDRTTAAAQASEMAALRAMVEALTRQLADAVAARDEIKGRQR